jgi:hypothetical protein
MRQLSGRTSSSRSFFIPHVRVSGRRFRLHHSSFLVVGRTCRASVSASSPHSSYSRFLGGVVASVVARPKVDAILAVAWGSGYRVSEPEAALSADPLAATNAVNCRQGARSRGDRAGTRGQVRRDRQLALRQEVDRYRAGTGRTYKFNLALSKAIQNAADGKGLALTFIRNLVGCCSALATRSPEARNPLAERVSDPMELAGLEPATSWVRSRRSPS